MDTITFPGPAAALIVTPEEETVLENRKSPEFKVQAVDLAGNNTSLEGKQYVVCTVSVFLFRVLSEFDFLQPHN